MQKNQNLVQAIVFGLLMVIGGVFSLTKHFTFAAICFSLSAVFSSTSTKFNDLKNSDEFEKGFEWFKKRNGKNWISRGLK